MSLLIGTGLGLFALAWAGAGQHVIHVSPTGDVTDGRRGPCSDPPYRPPPDFSRVPARSRAKVMRFYHDVTLVHRNEMAAISRNREADLATVPRDGAMLVWPGHEADVERERRQNQARRDDIRRESDAARDRSIAVYERMRSALLSSLPAADRAAAQWVLADWIYTCAKPR